MGVGAKRRKLELVHPVPCGLCLVLCLLTMVGSEMSHLDACTWFTLHPPEVPAGGVCGRRRRKHYIHGRRGIPAVRNKVPELYLR